MAGHERRQKPREEGEGKAEDQVDPHGTANSAQENLGLVGSALGGDVLDVSVAETGGDDGADADNRGGDSPDAVPGDAEMVKHDGGDQKHAHRISCIVDDAVECVGEVSLD